MPTRSSITALAAAAATLLLLAGCSGGQSRSDACAEVDGAVRDAVAGIQSQAGTLQSDPEKAVERLRAEDEQLADAVDRVDNDAVQDKAEALERAFKGVVDELEASTDDPDSADASKLTAATTELQRSGEAFDAACKD